MLNYIIFFVNQGHGDPGPLHYKHHEQRHGYDTKVRGKITFRGIGIQNFQGQYHVELPGKSYKHLTYHVSSKHH